MRKLIHAVAAGLLMLPMLTVNATDLNAKSMTSVSPPTHTLAGTCYINVGGVWIGYPC